jgi:hypothetical protein
VFFSADFSPVCSRGKKIKKIVNQILAAAFQKVKATLINFTQGGKR